jgi:DNA-binding NarL/FixJ family response regulator
VKLSPRQEQVAALVVQGYSAKRIASMLKTYDPATGASRPLSTRTVNDYISEIAAKIGGGPSTGTGSLRVRITRWWYTQNPANTASQ